MCRSTDFSGYRLRDRDRLKICGFYIRFSDPNPVGSFPESLTLIYLPRISESSLEINGSKIRPDQPAFVTLHRVVSEGPENGGGVAYGSRDRVWAGEGLQFEVYVREEKAMKGVFRRDEYGEWAIDCKCVLETAALFRCGTEAEVSVSTEGQVEMVEKVGMMAARRRRKRELRFCCLEEIPEEREVAESESEGSYFCCCSCSEDETTSDGGEGEELTQEGMEVNTEGVRWAVDVGMWVVCLGVGILVSRSSARRTLRRIRLLRLSLTKG